MRTEDQLTVFMMKFCYTCPRGCKCETEEDCRNCMDAVKRHEDGAEEGPTTEELLRLYAY
ncbi:hypothetical protein [Marinicrinis lubricantis]|uniref:Uncharacterized protein n=1 Tax=Marinicrinis lubricantis TaxID=2086470 RepID=A0ABW1IST8_9BACL